jgi:uncharacterized protein YbjT (DUF2867 family)
VARALIVGCGCRGRELGRALLEAGWQVRGTTRDPANVDAIEAAGIEPLVADPDRIGEVLEGIDGVSLIYWLLGSAVGDRDAVEALHGPRLARLLEEIVDTPVRGFVYEATGGIDPDRLAEAMAILRDAGERWRIPFEVIDVAEADHEMWREAMLAAARELVG